MSSKPLLEWQVELMPYYETVFIYSCSICESCTAEVSFESDHTQYSEGWWFDEARAMKEQGWVVPRVLVTYCEACAREQNIKHDPDAYELRSL